MGSWSQKRSRSSSKSGRCSRVEEEGGGVLSDDRGPLAAGDNLADHHVWPVEAR